MHPLPALCVCFGWGEFRGRFGIPGVSWEALLRSSEGQKKGNQLLATKSAARTGCGVVLGRAGRGQQLTHRWAGPLADNKKQ